LSDATSALKAAIVPPPPPLTPLVLDADVDEEVDRIPAAEAGRLELLPLDDEEDGTRSPENDTLDELEELLAFEALREWSPAVAPRWVRM